MPLQMFSNIDPNAQGPGFMEDVMKIMHQQRVEHLSKNPHFARTPKEQNDIDLRTKKKLLAEKQVAGTYELAELLTALEIDQFHYEPKGKVEEVDASTFVDPKAIVHVYSNDKPVLNQVTYKQAVELRAWQVEYRKALKFDSQQWFDKVQNCGSGCDIVPRFREFVELTSQEDHPYHKEGQYVQDFMDNKFNKWVAYDYQYFDQYFALGMVLNTEAKDYKQINYTVPFCEYNNQIENFEEKALSMNKFQEFKKLTKICEVFLVG
jgi:hypothetical protein